MTAWVRATPGIGKGPDVSLPIEGLPPAPRGQLETIEDLLVRSNRDSVPLRRTFVQTVEQGRPRAGALAGFVFRADARGLESYLLVHAVASAEPWSCTYPAHTWVRALGLARRAEPGAARAAVSKAMRRVSDRKLISVSRTGRLATYTLLNEDGSGAPYTRPRTKEDPWFHLPYAYWSDGWYDRLDLPAKAMLMIALSLPSNFSLPQDRVPTWYGLSSKTAQRGMNRLIAERLLVRTTGWELEPASETGWITRNRYNLAGAFAKSRPNGDKS